MMKADLMGLPAMVTRDLNIRRDIETAVATILNKTADRLKSRAKTLKPDERTARRVPQSNARALTTSLDVAR